MGRIKLGANVLGASIKAINDSVKYSNERKQFGVLISTFGTIKHKMAEQVIRTFAAESANFRVSKDIDDLLNKYMEEGCDKGIATIDAISHYAVEAAILKVYSSEVLDFVIDEAVQIHGGMGYSAEMAVEKGYRDSRINRIFEGTNEINTLLVIDTAMKRAMKGDFDLFGEAEKLYANLDNVVENKKSGEDYSEEKLRYTRNFKKATLLLVHKASKKYEKQLVHEQEILNNLSVMVMQIYATESTALRVQKMIGMKCDAESDLYKKMLDVLIYDAAAKIRKEALDAIYSIAPDDDKLVNAVESLTKVEGVNTREARRAIANKLIEDNVYKF
jgi:hypothetical protein